MASALPILSERLSMFLPTSRICGGIMKKVARAPAFSRLSSCSPVNLVVGPSSKVTKTIFLFLGWVEGFSNH